MEALERAREILKGGAHKFNHPWMNKTMGSRRRSPRKVGGLVRGVDLIKGNLSKYGYHDVKHKSAAARHAALNRAVRAYGKNKVIESLAARLKLNMAANHTAAAKAMFADLQWLS